MYLRALFKSKSKKIHLMKYFEKKEKNVTHVVITKREQTEEV